ncbi:MAG: DUF3857 and transglutaminase domain-containing protein [Pseudomonadota bacterium]
MPVRLVAALCCLLLAGAARADDTDPSLVIERYVQHFVVNPDGSYQMTVDNVKSIAQQRAVQAHSQYYISYNRTLDEVSAISAYTRKRDGRRIAVGADQIKDQQEAASSEAPMFQDTRMKVIVFPDVAVGDQLVVHYVLKRHSALFPGHFEDLSSSMFVLNRQFELIYDMPASMPLHADAVGFVALPAASSPGRQVYRWQYVNGPNDRVESESVSYLDYGKRLAVSTFADYSAFARAYHGPAQARAVPSAAITELATDITSGLADDRARALALSDWVRRNIRYVAVYIGPGGVVPHAAATVLENRYGDCKDHAALLEALLQASGIDSSAVLVNSGNAYRLPRVPTLGIFNHVITYVPALELYLDSTAESIAAGYLPASVMGKPVLHARSGQLARTPATQPERSRTYGRFEIERDGRSKFRIAKVTQGAMAEPYRQAVRDTKPADRALFVRQLLQGLGQQGDGSFDPGKLDSDGDEYSMRMAGVSDNFANLPGPTGVPTSFDFWGGLGATVLALAQEKQRKHEFMCPAIDSEDEIGFTFPKDVKIIALPRGLSLRDANFSYQARYLRRANSVTVRRQLRFRHDGMVCTPAHYQRMRPLLERMLRDLKSQIIVAGSG